MDCRKLTQVDYSADLNVSDKKMTMFLACKNVAISVVYMYVLGKNQI